MGQVEERRMKRQTYRLFDHVTVTIQIKGSESHAHKLAFYLLSKKASAKSGRGFGKGEIDFLQEIRKDRDVESALEAESSEIEMVEEVDENDLPKKRAKKQTAYDF